MTTTTRPRKPKPILLGADKDDLILPSSPDISRAHHTREPYQDPGVRIYPSGPGVATLQIRTSRLILSAALDAEDLRTLAAHLVALARGL